MVKLTQKVDDWQTTDAGKSVASVESTGKPTAGGSCTITVAADGTVTIVYA